MIPEEEWRKWTPEQREIFGLRNQVEDYRQAVVALDQGIVADPHGEFRYCPFCDAAAFAQRTKPVRHQEGCPLLTLRRHGLIYSNDNEE